MKLLTQIELLRVWEQGLGLTPPQRVVSLLRASGETEPGRLPIGARDALLIRVRENLFGERLDSTVACPLCAEEQEFQLSTSGILVPPGAVETKLSASFEGAGYEFRLPNSNDLVSIQGAETLDEAKRNLVLRCLGGDGTASLPEGAIDAISDAMAKADPQADIEISLECFRCSHRWAVAFDIASFLLSEIQEWALRSMHQVHKLASAYGWSEAEVLEVGPWRRAYYLELMTT